jgi:3-hydroxybutyryl-CoA dehydratase
MASSNSSTTQKSRWAVTDVMVRNQNDEQVATGEAIIEFPLA